MKKLVVAASVVMSLVFAGILQPVAAKTKPQTPQQGNSASSDPSANSNKKPGSTCDKSKQATADYKTCLDAAAKSTQNKGKTKKQGN